MAHGAVFSLPVSAANRVIGGRIGAAVLLKRTANNLAATEETN
jgi:phosphate/sulfate permease